MWGWIFSSALTTVYDLSSYDLELDYEYPR